MNNFLLFFWAFTDKDNWVSSDAQTPSSSNPPPIPTSILLDDDLWQGLGEFALRAKFKLSYDRGALAKRQATLIERRDNGEVQLVFTDHRTSQPVHRQVSVAHLEPAAPIGKNCQCVVMRGSRKGLILWVTKFVKKTGEAELAPSRGNTGGTRADVVKERVDDLCIVQAR